MIVILYYDILLTKLLWMKNDATSLLHQVVVEDVSHHLRTQGGK
jgi:hypothetical protein